jgi:aspartate--ammonia ligase
VSYKLTIPEGYRPNLGVMETQLAIKVIKDTFERELAHNLNLTRVSAPIAVPADSGLNDTLNGVERPVSFDIPSAEVEEAQIVQSLAKWKRRALHDYGFVKGYGLYTDMNAIRRDEELDNLHSIYVDQWDWERIIGKEDRNLDFLEEMAGLAYDALLSTQKALCAAFPAAEPMDLPERLFTLTAQQLLDRYPHLPPNAREDAICEAHGAVLLTQIGKTLSDGSRHDGRAPDYDDWDINADILLWNPVLKRAYEISSMGVRVDAEAMDRQLRAAGCDDRRTLPFHADILANRLPLTVGGGIGQSRICMYLLRKAHIGEVQASIWPAGMVEKARLAGIFML